MYTKEMFDALLEKMKDELEDVKELEVEIGIDRCLHNELGSR